jgi:hypothetical protein
MGKSAHDDVLDALGNYLQTNGNKMTVCETEPTTYTEANSNKGSGGKALADVALAGGDYALADDTSGRKVTIAEKADVEIDVSGDADHVAIVDTVNSKLLYVTTCTQQALVAANYVTFPAWKINVQDPT